VTHKDYKNCEDFSLKHPMKLEIEMPCYNTNGRKISLPKDSFLLAQTPPEGVASSSFKNH